MSLGRGLTDYEAVRLDQVNAGLDTIHPFADKCEWELAKWIIKSGISQGASDNLLKLEMVRKSILFRTHLLTNLSASTCS
jgi:hypothetical protein